MDREGTRIDIRSRLREFPSFFVERIEAIPSCVMETLMRHRWAGNMRELQNFIERSVIPSCGPMLNAPLSELTPIHDTSAAPVTLRDAERAHILRVLREMNGVIAGAAVRLGMPRSTLFYKMRRLGIGRDQIFQQAL